MNASIFKSFGLKTATETYVWIVEEWHDTDIQEELCMNVVLRLVVRYGAFSWEFSRFVLLFLWNLLETGKDYIKVIFISTSMGLVFSKSLSYTISYYMSQDYIHTQFFLYVCIMSFFHYSEYVSVAVFNPNDLKMYAFMLTHSWEYGLALCTSLAEMGVESYFFPFLKGNIYFISLGLLMTSCVRVYRLSKYVPTIIDRLLIITLHTFPIRKRMSDNTWGHLILTGAGIQRLWAGPFGVALMLCNIPWESGLISVQLKSIRRELLRIIIYCVDSAKCDTFYSTCFEDSFFNSEGTSSTKLPTVDLFSLLVPMSSYTGDLDFCFHLQPSLYW